MSTELTDNRITELERCATDNLNTGCAPDEDDTHHRTTLALIAAYRAQAAEIARLRTEASTAVMRGCVLTLYHAFKHSQSDRQLIRDVAHDLGITVAVAKQAGCPDVDVDLLERALQGGK